MNTKYNDTKNLYNNNANLWERNTPSSLSDFTARPIVLDAIGNVKDLRVLDLGCGEGYMTRQVAMTSPAQITGIDISEKMIELAKKNNTYKYCEFYVCSSKKLTFENEYFEIIFSVFMYNYMPTSDMLKSFLEVYRCLKPNGRFI